jgi:taurine transport system permease protein
VSDLVLQPPASDSVRKGAVPQRRPVKRMSRGTRLISLATVVCLLLAWGLVSNLRLVPPLFLPTPQAVLHKLVTVTTTGFADATLLQHLAASLGRVFAALALALVVAVPVGLAIGTSRVARGILDPLIEFYRPIPPLSYLPLIIIWCGIGEASKVLVIFLAIFAPIAISTASGVRAVPPDRLRAARALGATRAQLLRHVILPNALPEILTGVRIGLGVGWSTLVAAELVAATSGLGFMIQSAAQFLVTDVVILGILVIAAVAFAMETLLRLLQRRLTPWHGRI